MRSARLLISIAMGAVVAALIGLTILNFFYRSEITTGNAITNDIQQLVTIFERINDDCTIISFDFQQNPINFLNVEKFEGSEVGSMNLARPERWRGPYVGDNPTVQGKEYMIVKTELGYFITPGNGVELPRKKVIGTDIVLDEKANIPQLIADKTLTFQSRAMAAELKLAADTNSDYVDIWRIKH